MDTSIIFQIQSFLILTVLSVGVYYRTRKSLHVKMMYSAIIWDLLLILQIEGTRHAINKASQVISNPIILTIHVLLALTCVLGYFYMIFSGRNILKGDRSKFKRHKRMGWTVYSLRILVFITSFFVVQ